MNEPTDKATNDPRKDAQFADEAKQLFDDSVDSLDAATLSRLNQGRLRALAELSSTRTRGQWLGWIPAAGVAVAVLVTVMIMRGPNGVDIPIESVTTTDFEILLDEDSLEMLEDLEFYSWLESVDLDANGNVG